MSLLYKTQKFNLMCLTLVWRYDEVGIVELSLREPTVHVKDVYDKCVYDMTRNTTQVKTTKIDIKSLKPVKKVPLESTTFCGDAFVQISVKTL